MEERQGHKALQPETGPCIATRPDLKRLIIIDPMQTHNPDTDRLGSGQFCIQYPAQDSTLCTVHMPSGHTVGCHWTGSSRSTGFSLHRNQVLTVPLKQLWHSYSYAADQQEQKEPGP